MKSRLYSLILPFYSIIYGCDSSSNFAKTSVKNVDVKEFKKLSSDKGSVILDVRTRKEFDRGHLENAVNINFYDNDFLEQCIKRFNKDALICVYCQSGGRSKKAADLLAEKDYKVVNLQGGISSWEKAGEKVVTD